MLVYNHDIPGTEEEIIYEIVDNILSTQDKIKDIQFSIQNIDETKGLGFKLRNLKNEIKKNISSINDLKNQITEKENQFNEYKIKYNLQIKKILNEIYEKDRKLRNISSNKNDEIYKISYEKIEDIIKKKKDQDELKNISIEYNTTDNLKRNIENSLTEKINEREEVTERLLMLKEEKDNLNEQLIDLISEKESLEELSKLYIQNIYAPLNGINGADSLNQKKIYVNNNNIKDFEVNLFFFEICKININKTSNDIANILVNFIIHNNLVNDDLSNDETFIQYKKNEFINIIQNDLINFIQSNNKKNKKIIEKFLDSLSNKILNEIQINIPIEKISNLLKYVIKVNYYESVIENNLTFLNRDYKYAKRENKRIIKEKQNEINKLASKQDEIEFLLNQIKEKKDTLIEKNANQLINLSPQEREYLNLSEKIGELINQKKEIEYDFDEREQCLNMLIDDIKNQINEIIKINNILENKMKIVLNNIEKENEEKKRIMDDLKESIKEKFKMIKMQLSIYKKKHGNNMELYDKFVEKINTNLRLSSKSLLNNDSLLNTSYMSSIILSPTNESKNNSLIHSNSRAYRTNNNNINFNSISSNSIFSPPKNISKYHNNSYYNPLLNSSSLPYFSPIRSRNFDYYYNLYNSNKKQVMKNNNDKIQKLSDEIINDYKKERKNSSLWEEEKTKLLNSMKSINNKQRFIKGNKSDNLNFNYEKENTNLSKLNMLNNLITCFYRVIRGNENKFDPLNHSDKIQEMNFEKISMKINEKISHLCIYQYNNLIYQIPIENMETTIVNNNLKYIIKIYQKYKHIMKKDGFVDIDTFVKSKDFKNIPFDFNHIKKAVKNNLYNIQLSYLNDGLKQRIEFVFLNYEDVKLWLNGLNYVIKNKN